ncbi:hypothetical protein A2U01_0005077, partial [Trifolium medium]|nr:hypothetical protein [Trifolium medium]
YTGILSKGSISDSCVWRKSIEIGDYVLFFQQICEGD